jgi:methyl-accepting chemotaxis protein
MDSSLDSVQAVTSSTELASQTIERIGNSTHAIERSIANITDALGDSALPVKAWHRIWNAHGRGEQRHRGGVGHHIGPTQFFSHDLQGITARFQL